MEIRREMSQHDSDKGPVTFHDVAACFSEEEWKLLHEWQKELYRNVMKDIHQALISLGPLIAASVFSLKAKENGDLCPVDHQDSERRDGIDHSPSLLIAASVSTLRPKQNDYLGPVNHRDSERGHGTNHSPSDAITSHDVVFRLNGEESLHLKNPSNTEEREIHDCLSPAFPFFNPDICFKKKKEQSASLKDHLGAERRESSTGHSTGHAVSSSIVSFHIKEESETHPMQHQDSERREIISRPTGYPFFDSDMCLRSEEESSVSLMGHPGAEEGTSSSDPSSGHLAIHKVVSVSIKEEQATYFMGHQDSESVESIIGEAGDGSMKRKKKGDYVENTEKILRCKASSGKAAAVPLQSSEKGAHYTCQLLSENNPELDKEKATQCYGSFNFPKYSSFPQGSAKVNRLNNKNELDSNLGNVKFLLCHQNTQHNQAPYTYAELGKSLSEEGECFRLGKTQTRMTPRDRPFKCTDCEKRFTLKGDLNRHQRTHTGEKPYTCTDCQKSFNRKDNLNEHRRIHTSCRMREVLQTGNGPWK